MSKADASSSGSIVGRTIESSTVRNPRDDLSSYISPMLTRLEHSMRRSGISIVSAAILLTASACRFPYGLSGGGLPPNIHTMAILPFEDRAPSPNVQQELLERMRSELRRRLGVGDASEDKADAIVRGTIVDYQPDIAVGYSTQSTSARRRVQITIDVEIYDIAKG